MSRESVKDERAVADFVPVTDERDVTRAHYVAGALEEAGVPTFVDDNLLMDEFAMSQKAMGLLRIRVLVPADRLEEARAVLLNLSQPLPLVDEAEDELDPSQAPAQRRARRIALWLLLLGPLSWAIVWLVSWLRTL